MGDEAGAEHGMHLAAAAPPTRAMTSPLDAVIRRFAARPDAQFCAIAGGAQNNCDVLARRFAHACRCAGLPAVVVALQGRLEDYPSAHPRWHARVARTTDPWLKTDRARLRHYVTRVTTPEGVRLVDWTFRQFLPEASHPLIVPTAEGDAVVALPTVRDALACWESHGVCRFGFGTNDLAIETARLRRRVR